MFSKIIKKFTFLTIALFAITPELAFATLSNLDNTVSKVKDEEPYFATIGEGFTAANASNGIDDAWRRFSAADRSSASVAAELPPQSEETISPEIVQSIHNLEDIHAFWKQVGIRSNLFKGRVSFIKVSRFDADYYSIMQLTDDLNWDFQYVILTKNDEGWKFAGNIDLGMQKSGPPELQIFDSSEKEKWFSIKFLKTSGTGWAQVDERLFSVEKNSLRELLRYPAHGGNEQSGMQPVFVDFAGEIIDRNKIIKRTMKVQIQYMISFRSGYCLEFPCREKLFTAERTLSYSWDPVEKKFKVDSPSSSLLKELGSNFSKLKEDDLLKRYYRELEKMALEGNRFKQKWLKRFLSECKDSAQKQALLKLIN